jgi:ABC transport system ATP-binding/permease protein
MGTLILVGARIIGFRFMVFVLAHLWRRRLEDARYDSVTRALLFALGAKRDLLQRAPTDDALHANLGTSVFTTAVTAALSTTDLGPAALQRKGKRRPSAQAFPELVQPLTVGAEHPVTVAADRVSVTVRGDRAIIGSDPRQHVLLEDASFIAEPGQVVAVIGPSGAGKSTLVKAMAGALPVQGKVLYNGTPLTIDNQQQIRRQIGYVPQDDILHGDLTLRKAFSYAARLRLPDFSEAQRSRAVEGILRELLLTEQADIRVRDLSGGQRKRASVGIELLARPTVIFLDEPTTGLDPDAERLLVRILRRLAHEGRHTIVMTTHSAMVLPDCDRLLVIGRSGDDGPGKIAYHGPPNEALRFFGTPHADFASVYESLRDPTDDWPARFGHSLAAVRYVLAPLAALEQREMSSRPSWASPVKQMWLLGLRNLDVTRGNEKYWLALICQAPAMVMLLLIVLGLRNLDGGTGAHPRGLLAFTAVAALAIGLINSCREIVKESDVVRREGVVGMHTGAYLASKLLYLAALSALQSILLSLVMFGQGGVSRGLVLPSRLGETAVILFASALVAIAGGLAVSAMVHTDAMALVMAPLILVGQLLLSGAFFTVEDNAVLTPVAYATPAYWSFSALAASNNLNNLEKACPAPQVLPPPGSPARAPASCGDYWSHNTGTLALDISMLAVLFTTYLAVAVMALRRSSDLRRSL